MAKIRIDAGPKDPHVADYVSQVFDWLTISLEKGMTGKVRRPAYDRKRYDEYLKSSKWARKRRVALSAAKHRCQLCNSPRKLQVHHRTYLRLYKEHPSDLTVLCETCHQLFHKHRKLAK